MQFTKPNAWKQPTELQAFHSLPNLRRPPQFTQFLPTLENMTINNNVPTPLNHVQQQALFLIPTKKVPVLVLTYIFKITPRRSLTKKHPLRLVMLHLLKNMNPICHFNHRRVTSNAQKIVAHHQFQYRLLIVKALPTHHTLRLRTILIGSAKTLQPHHRTIVVVLMDL